MMRRFSQCFAWLSSAENSVVRFRILQGCDSRQRQGCVILLSPLYRAGHIDDLGVSAFFLMGLERVRGQ